MRIVAGEWRGRRLVALSGGSTRPTADRTREALFSMLTSRMGSFENLLVADLYAGSGAAGLEALSRGASKCLFVEQDTDALRAIRANVTTLAAADRAEIRRGDVLALAGGGRVPDLILIDPPYGTGAAQVTLAHLLAIGWVGAATWLAVETGREEVLASDGWDTAAEREVGRAKLWLLRSGAAVAP